VAQSPEFGVKFEVVLVCENPNSVSDRLKAASITKKIDLFRRLYKEYECDGRILDRFDR